LEYRGEGGEEGFEGSVEVDVGEVVRAREEWQTDARRP